jgi:pimeloyl-ACP methyl ester carboxylesterase
LIVVMLLLLSACGDDQPAETTAAPPTTSTAATTAALTTTLPPTTTTSLPPTTTTAAPASSTTAPSPEVTEDLVYGAWGDELLTLDMYVPTESDGAPVVILFHGRQSQIPPWIPRDLVMQGALVFDVVEYPFGNHPEIPAEALIADGGAGHRAIAESAACAIHYARARASEQGSESPVVVLAGHSMGTFASIAALFGSGIETRWEEYAVAQDGPPRQVDCEITDGSTHVDAFVGMAGTYSMFVGNEEGYGREFMQERDPDLWEFLYGSIGENPDLRVHLIHGEQDTVVPYDESVVFEAELAEAGYDVRLIPFYGDHGIPEHLAVPTIIDAIQP